MYGVVPVALYSSIAFLNQATCGATSVKTNTLTGIPVYSCTGTANACDRSRHFRCRSYSEQRDHQLGFRGRCADLPGA